jgi:hypothetical protein
MSGAHLSAPQGSSRFHTPAPRQRFAAFFSFDFSFDLDVQAKNPCRNLEPNNARLLRPALTAHPNRLRQHAAARASRRPCRASAATGDLPDAPFFDSTVQPPAQKIFRFFRNPNQL